MNGVRLESCTGGPGGLPRGVDRVYLLPTAEPAAAPGGREGGSQGLPAERGAVTGLGEGDRSHVPAGWPHLSGFILRAALRGRGRLSPFCRWRN